jgi:hypothetical protein
LGENVLVFDGEFVVRLWSVCGALPVFSGGAKTRQFFWIYFWVVPEWEFAEWIKEGIPQGLKPLLFCGIGRAKAEALAYLEAKTRAERFWTAMAGWEFRGPFGRLFDFASRGEAARGFAQDDVLVEQ